MKYIIMILLISSFLRASNHYGINFTNDEESATTFNINHSSYQHFKDLKFSSTHASQNLNLKCNFLVEKSYLFLP